MRFKVLLVLVAAALGVVSATSAEAPAGYQPCTTVSASGLMSADFSSVVTPSDAQTCEAFDSYYCTKDDDVLDTKFRSTPPSGVLIIVR